MTIRTLALDSGVTSIQDHRLALGAFMGPGASVLERRAGVSYYPGAADLTSAAALQANVTPFIAIVDGTSNSLQGQIPVVVDTNVTLTFSAGEPAVARVDRVILQIRDTTYDASGSTDARVLVLKGSTSTGAAATLPASSLLLWEVTVPIGASSITFSSARVDRRQWIATPMRIPVNSQTERDALPAIPGLEATRLDTGAVEQYWSGAWRTLLPVAAPTSSVSFVRKTSSTSRASTITRTNDPELTLAVAANSVYVVELFLVVSGSGGDFYFTFAGPSGAVAQIVNAGIDAAATANSGIIDMNVGDIGQNVGRTYTGSVPTAAIPRGILTTGASAGNFTLQWAQLASNASATILNAYSFMRLEKVA